MHSCTCARQGGLYMGLGLVYDRTVGSSCVCVCVCVCLVCFHSPAAVNSIVIINIDSSAPARYRCKSKHHSWECEHVEYARGCLVCAVTQNRTAKGLDYLKQALAWYKEKVSQFRYVQESEFFIMAL